MKTVLTIAGSDSGAGAGIQADLKTFAAFGIYGTCAITAVTAQNTKKVEAVYELPAEFVGKQIDAVMNDINPRVWKTGMLVNSEIINTVINKIDKYKIKHLIVDPLMVSKSGQLLLTIEARQLLIKKILPLTFVITPNCPEAEVLTGYKIHSVNDMKKAAVTIHTLGAKYVVVKGGHLQDDAYSIDVVFDGKKFIELKSKRIKTKNTHGTGCTFASAITAGIAKGNSFYIAVADAKKYIDKKIRESSYVRIGHGYGPLQAI